MKYCTFKYKIEYADNTVYEGWSPFRGHEIREPLLIKFVQDFFQESKPVLQVSIFDVFEISDPRIWMAHIRNTIEYRYLYMVKGFAIDVLKKYYPEDVR